jgi:predicted NUDIX family phosphoesterase
MAVNKNDTARSKLKTIMMRNLRKEITEELNLNFGDILEIEPLYLIQSNDNKVSSEHMGVISLIKIDTRLLDYEIESGEPEKHEVAHLTKYDLSNMELMCRYDTWLKKCIIKMKEDGLI